jgi:hypothetical protein
LGSESARPRGFTVELAEQADPEIGHELIRVHHRDGHTEELHLHDYARLYSLPGAYEEIVHERLGCRSPRRMASLLAAAADGIGRERAEVRVLDLAAGNGVSGEALAAEGLVPVLGTDLVQAARAAALRDRPGLYESYLTLDLMALSDSERATIRALRANAISCVAPVGDGPEQLPPRALLAAAALLQRDALVAYMHDFTLGGPDAVTAELWVDGLGEGLKARELERRRYLHRYTVNGEPYEMDGVVWRLTRRVES